MSRSTSDTPDDVEVPVADNVLLWLDFETLGLDTRRVDVVEVAWQFTDLDHEPLGDLHSRLCAIGELARKWRLDLREGQHAGEGAGYAPVGPILPPVVVAMHHDSGLAIDHASTNGRRIVHTWSLLAKELIATWPAGPGGSLRTAHVAGMGVAAFDLQIIRQNLTRLIPEGAFSYTNLPWHYRAFDVSQAEFVVTAGQRYDVLKTAELVVKQAEAKLMSEQVGVEVAAVLELDCPVNAVRDPDGVVLRHVPIQHRAAADVLMGRLLGLLLAYERRGIAIPWVR